MFSHPPEGLYESDPMFDGLSIPKLTELSIKTDLDLSSDKPSDDYAEYIRERNLSEVSESQKLAKQLSVPKRPSSVPREAKDPKATSALPGGMKCQGEAKPFTAFIECCCGPESLLTSEAQKKGFTTLRLTKPSHDLFKLSGLRKAKRDILNSIKNDERVKMRASLPCKPWSRRQTLIAHRLGPDSRNHLQDMREESLVSIDSFLELATVVMRSGGVVSFEWPAYATGWKIPQLDQFFRANGFHDAVFHGCALGLKDQGRRVNKPWRIRTTCRHLSDAMSKHVCDCPPGAHAPC